MSGSEKKPRLRTPIRLSEGVACSVYELPLGKMGGDCVISMVIKKCPLTVFNRHYLRFVQSRHKHIEFIARIKFTRNAAYIFSQKLSCTLFEYVEHQRHRPQREAAPPRLSVRDIYKQCSAGLSFIHNMGMIHADIKNNNIMFAPDGCVKIIDFSNSFSAADARARQINVFGQTLLLMSHIVLLSDPYAGDFSVDMWALAMTLYWYETGEHFIQQVVLRYNLSRAPFANYEASLRNSQGMRLNLSTCVAEALKHLHSKCHDTEFGQVFFECLAKPRGEEEHKQPPQ